jgi:hypothetical protein
MKTRRMRRTGHVAHMGEKGNTCRILMRMPQGISSRGLEDNIKMDLSQEELTSTELVLASPLCLLPWIYCTQTATFSDHPFYLLEQNLKWRILVTA